MQMFFWLNALSLGRESSGFFPSRAQSSNDAVLEREDKPSFQTIEYTEDFKLNDRINKHRVFNGTYTGTSRKEFEFFGCSVELKSPTFSDNFAFGAGRSSASGGAIFVSASVMTVKGEGSFSTFENNRASIGGAIAAICSPIFVQTTEFRQNIGWKWAGAIYTQGKTKEVWDQYKSYVIDSKFIQNKADSLGGAIVTSIIGELYIEGSNFSSNWACLSGGALWLFNTPAKLFSAKFEDNEADSQVNSHENMTHKNSIKFFGMRSRGGGAISFSFTFNEQRAQLVTQQCCFKNNAASYGFTNENNGGGHEILFDMQSPASGKWISFEDVMATSSLVISKQGNMDYQIFGTKKSSDGCQPIDENYKPQSAKPTLASPNTNVSGVTSYVPSPTNYTYVASPITRLPYATTSSFVYMPTARNITLQFSAKTVKAAPTPTILLPISQTIMPTNTPHPTASRVYIDGKPFYPTMSVFTTLTDSSYYSLTLTQISTSYINDLTSTFGIVATNISTMFITEIPTSYYTESFLLADDGEADQTKASLDITLIIGIAGGALVLIIIIIIVIVFFTRKKNDKTTDDQIEMNEETVVIRNDTNSVAITNDNPLWTTSVTGDIEDPFRNDFEETATQGLFPALKASSDSDSHEGIAIDKNDSDSK